MHQQEAREICFTVNGRARRVKADAGVPLLYVLRNDFGLNGPKFGCGLGECGACSVLIDGRLARSCVVPVVSAEDREVTTLEGLGGDQGLHPVQQAFIREQAAQCGYCTNGMILTTVAFLSANADPTDKEIADALRYNLCRCGTHVEICSAVRAAARLMRDES